MNPGQLSKNILSSWAGYGLRFAINLLFIPFITSVLGEDRYGIWVICFQIIGYFSLFELGLDRALLRFIPKSLGRQDISETNRLLNTATLIYFAGGFIVILASYTLANPILSLFNTTIPALTVEGVIAFKTIGLYLGIRFWLTPFGGSLGSFQRSDLANLLQGIEDIIRTLLMIWVLLKGGGLPSLAIVITATTALRLLAGLIMLKRLHPNVSYTYRAIDRLAASTLMRYGATSLVVSVASVIIHSSDGPILGALVNTAAAGLFAPAAQLMLYMRHLVNTIGAPLSAALSQFDAEGDKKRIDRTYLSASRLASVVSFLVGSGVLMYAPDFVHLWLEPEFAQTGQVMRVLAIGAVFFVPQIIGTAVLFGLERQRHLLSVMSIEAVVKITLAVWLVDKYGLLGMAWAGVIPQIALYTTLFPWIVSKVLALPIGVVLRTNLLTGIKVAVFAIPTAWGARKLIEPDSWFSLSLNVLIVTLVSAIPAYFSLTKDERSAIRFHIGIK